MTMDLSNQNKLSEFYEELKRLNIKIIRPDINLCFSNFKTSKDNFYYSLGAIKNVGQEAVANIVIEREKDVQKASIESGGKSQEIIEKILDGKMKKFFSESTLLNQKFILDTEKSVKDIINEFPHELEFKLISYELLILNS